MKKIVMTLAFVMFAGLFMSSAAEARCWWNGYRTVCTHRHYWSGHYYPYRHHGRYYLHRTWVVAVNGRPDIIAIFSGKQDPKLLRLAAHQTRCDSLNV